MDARLALDYTQLNRLKAEARVDRKQAARAAAREFETLFIRQMFKVMRDSLPEDSLFSSSDMRMYQDWFDQQVAQEMGRQGALGLAEVIEAQLSPEGRQVPPRQNWPLSTADWLSRATVSNTGGVPAVTPPPPSASPVEEAVHANDANWRDNPKDFVQTLLPHARKAASALGVHPGMLLAQAALETGWGRHLPVNSRGEEALNLFGIKADAGWQGPVVESATKEVRQGQWQQEQARFRSFPDVQAAFEGLVGFLRGNPRYAQVLEQAGDPVAWAKGLQQAGYATDPAYADKLLGIFNRSEFRQWLDEAGENLKAGVGRFGLKFSADRSITADEPAL